MSAKGNGWAGSARRGKLHELNQLLRGSTNTTFMPIGGRPPANIAGVRYVITLDADTRLPRGAAARLVGTMAHPLNRPSFSARDGRVVEGYAIVQPRITPSLPIEHLSSLSQRVFSGPGGIDPYSSAVSDVYQDLFQEGSYTGKGIYDIDAFESALAGKVPANALLSHDLFEGIFARVALATDIELFEEFPSRYEVVAARQHRWARGDWQLLPWLFGRGYPEPGKRNRYPDSNDRPLEDSRQSAPHSVGARRISDVGSWVASADCLSLDMDAIHSRNSRDPGAAAISHRT